MIFKPSLDEIIRSTLISDLPQALPALHVTVLKILDSIISDGTLKPQKCTIFGEELLYLFYGAAFYRTSNQPTREQNELPIAFLFNPKLLAQIKRYYPFDTGAMANGKFGNNWSVKLADFKERYKILGNGDWQIPCKMVSQIYENNDRYLKGVASTSCVLKPEPFPELYNFLTDDLTKFGADHRQSSIECQLDKPIILADYLEWIAIPEGHSGILTKIYEFTKPNMPQHYPYPCHVIFTPDHIIYNIQKEAEKYIEQRFI